jgi:hypothetical protein
LPPATILSTPRANPGKPTPTEFTADTRNTYKPERTKPVTIADVAADTPSSNTDHDTPSSDTSTR